MSQNYTLHPNLQQKVLDYFRLITLENFQIITVTHSPTIVEHATFNELFILKPVELISDNDNQLVPIATDEERLSFLRSIFGSTSNITALQPIIVVEGVTQGKNSSSTSDRKLYRALHKKFDAITLISGGGKSECIKLVEGLDQSLKSFSDKLKVIALLDSDTNDVAERGNIYTLPVSMIENFFIDPQVIWETIQSVIEKTDFKSVKDIEGALDKIITDYEEMEVTRRVIQKLGFEGFRAKIPIEKIDEQVGDFIKKVENKYSQQSLDRLKKEAMEVVEKIKGDVQRREQFMGKDILDKFFQEHLHNTGLSKPIFKYEAARHSKSRKSVNGFFDDFFNKVDSSN